MRGLLAMCVATCMLGQASAAAKAPTSAAAKAPTGSGSGSGSGSGTAQPTVSRAPTSAPTTKTPTKAPTGYGYAVRTQLYGVTENACPSGTAQITSAARCVEAARSLNMKDSKGKDFFWVTYPAGSVGPSSFPQGCSYIVSTTVGVKLVYNAPGYGSKRHTGSAIWLGARKLCRITANTATPTKVPTATPTTRLPTATPTVAASAGGPTAGGPTAAPKPSSCKAPHSTCSKWSSAGNLRDVEKDWDFKDCCSACKGTPGTQGLACPATQTASSKNLNTQKTCNSVSVSFSNTALAKRYSALAGVYKPFEARVVVNGAQSVKPVLMNAKPVFFVALKNAAGTQSPAAFLYFHQPEYAWVLDKDLPRRGDDGFNDQPGIFAKASGACVWPWHAACSWGGKVMMQQIVSKSTDCADGDCWSKPCLNGGTCSAYPLKGYSCSCATGWGGATCNLETWCEAVGAFSPRSGGGGKVDGSWCTCVNKLGSWFGINKNNSGAVRNRLGDNVCDHTFNIPECNYDGGDCAAVSTCNSNLTTLLRDDCCASTQGYGASDEKSYCTTLYTSNTQSSPSVLMPLTCTLRCARALQPFYRRCAFDANMDIPTYVLSGLNTHCTNALVAAGPKCEASGLRVSILKKCDGNCDCGKACDDEYGCTYSNRFVCSGQDCTCINNATIPATWRCDGKPDCGLSEDEQNCQDYLNLTEPWSEPLTIMSGGLSCSLRLEHEVLPKCATWTSCNSACQLAYTGWYFDCAWSLRENTPTLEEAASFFLCCWGGNKTTDSSGTNACKANDGDEGAPINSVAPCPSVAAADPLVKWIGDGKCDAALNCGAYAADGGDCDPGVTIALPYNVTGPFDRRAFAEALVAGVAFVDKEDVHVERFDQSVRGEIEFLHGGLNTRFFYPRAQAGVYARTQLKAALGSWLGIGSSGASIESIQDINARRRLRAYGGSGGSGGSGGAGNGGYGYGYGYGYGNGGSGGSGGSGQKPPPPPPPALSNSAPRGKGVTLTYNLKADKDVSAAFKFTNRNNSLSDAIRHSSPSIMPPDLAARHVGVGDPTITTITVVRVSVGRHEFEMASGKKLLGDPRDAAQEMERMLKAQLLNSSRIVGKLKLNSAMDSFSLTADSDNLNVTKERDDPYRPDEVIEISTQMATAVMIVLIFVAVLAIAMGIALVVLYQKKSKTKVLVVDKAGNVIATFESEVDDMEREMLFKMLHDKFGQEQAEVQAQQEKEKQAQMRKMKALTAIYAAKSTMNTAAPADLVQGAEWTPALAGDKTGGIVKQDKVKVKGPATDGEEKFGTVTKVQSKRKLVLMSVRWDDGSVTNDIDLGKNDVSKSTGVGPGKQSSPATGETDGEAGLELAAEYEKDMTVIIAARKSQRQAAQRALAEKREALRRKQKERMAAAGAPAEQLDELVDEQRELEADETREREALEVALDEEELQAVEAQKTVMLEELAGADADDDGSALRRSLNDDMAKTKAELARTKERKRTELDARLAAKRKKTGEKQTAMLIAAEPEAAASLAENSTLATTPLGAELDAERTALDRESAHIGQGAEDDSGNLMGEAAKDTKTSLALRQARRAKAKKALEDRRTKMKDRQAAELEEAGVSKTTVEEALAERAQIEEEADAEREKLEQDMDAAEQAAVDAEKDALVEGLANEDEKGRAKLAEQYAVEAKASGERVAAERAQKRAALNERLAKRKLSAQRKQAEKMEQEAPAASAVIEAHDNEHVEVDAMAENVALTKAELAEQRAAFEKQMVDLEAQHEAQLQEQQQKFKDLQAKFDTLAAENIADSITDTEEADDIDHEASSLAASFEAEAQKVGKRLSAAQHGSKEGTQKRLAQRRKAMEQKARRAKELLSA